MEIKLQHEELDQVRRTMVKDAEDFDSDIDKLLQQIEILKTIWQGQDAEKFYKNAGAYFDKMKDLPLAMMKMGKFIEKANGDFKESDQSFSKELETEVDEEYEQNSYNRYE
jgi:WXG100 family type VII secretion target